MRLDELSPRWLAKGDKRHGMGVSFRCPHCLIRLYIWFSNPIDGGLPVSVGDHPGKLWARSGTDFQTLTLYPTLNNEHWHGFLHRGVFIALR